MNTLGTHTTRFSIPSIIAVVAALLSFMTGAFWGFVFAIIAIVSAIIGIVAAMSPEVRGGAMSTLSLVAGVLALAAAVIKAVMWLF